VISGEEQLSRRGGGKYLVTLLGGAAASLQLHHVTARGEPKHRRSAGDISTQFIRANEEMISGLPILLIFYVIPLIDNLIKQNDTQYWILAASKGWTKQTYRQIMRTQNTQNHITADDLVEIE